jgi:hypothetical protein
MMKMVDDHWDENSNLYQMKHKSTGYVVCILTVLLIFGTSLLIWSIIHFTNKKNAPNNEQEYYMSNINGSKIEIFPFGSNALALYKIEFNTTIMQANYVQYVSQPVYNPCGSKCRYKNDPYNYSLLQIENYAGAGFERVSLVPDSDYGINTFYISNVIPLNGELYYLWRKNENYMKLTYPNKLVMKGCQYKDDDFVLINNQNFPRLFYPKFCYWIVFATNRLFSKPVPILEFGNICVGCDNSPPILPYWIQKM